MKEYFTLNPGTDALALLIMSIIVVGTILIIGSIAINREKQKKKWLKTIRPGDKCIHHYSGKIPHTIMKINEDTVELKSIIRKNLLYPEKYKMK